MGYYDETNLVTGSDRILLGYCAYDKSEIFQGDDIVRYKGELYHRTNFVQSQLDGHGNIIDPNEE